MCFVFFLSMLALVKQLLSGVNHGWSLLNHCCVCWGYTLVCSHTNRRKVPPFHPIDTPRPHFSSHWCRGVYENVKLIKRFGVRQWEISVTRYLKYRPRSAGEQCTQRLKHNVYKNFWAIPLNTNLHSKFKVYWKEISEIVSRIKPCIED